MLSSLGLVIKANSDSVSPTDLSSTSVLSYC